jgi:hypothetical protein
MNIFGNKIRKPSSREMTKIGALYLAVLILSSSLLSPETAILASSILMWGALFGVLGFSISKRPSNLLLLALSWFFIVKPIGLSIGEFLSN